MDQRMRNMEERFSVFTQNEEILQKVVDECPFSALSRLLLLRQSLKNGDIQENQEQLTALYFTRPLWMKYILLPARPRDRNLGPNVMEQPTPPEHATTSSTEESEVENTEAYGPNESPLTATGEDASLSPEKPTEEGLAAAEQHMDIDEAPVEESGEETPEIEPEAADEDQMQEEIRTEDTIIPGDQITESDEASIQEAGGENGENEIVPSIDSPTIDKNADEVESAETFESGPASQVEAEESIAADAPQQEEGAPPIEENTDDPVPIEPMHTVDYFAALGIHLTDADLSNDRLGKQLKSFTGWLKSMKKVHPTELPGQDEEVEKIIRRAAEISNLDTKVLTEAMAEVLVKQNKKEKAVALYEKLSLMDPSKSAYFAAKIEKLKSS